jgi:hypothetical protein
MEGTVECSSGCSSKTILRTKQVAVTEISNAANAVAEMQRRLRISSCVGNNGVLSSVRGVCNDVDPVFFLGHIVTLSVPCNHSFTKRPDAQRQNSAMKGYKNGMAFSAMLLTADRKLLLVLS